MVGPNGAGKSSLLDALGATIRDFEGRIERDPTLRVAYLPQASALDRSFPARVHLRRDFLAPRGWTTHSEPSAAAVARLIRQIKQEGVRAIFIENISDCSLASALA